MKRTINIILLLLVVGILSGCAHTRREVEWDDLRAPDDEYFWFDKETGKPFTGIVKTVDERHGGEVTYTPLKKGFIHGVQKIYGLDGQLRGITAYRKNKEHGKYRSWSNDGVLLEKSNYHDGGTHGKCWKYDFEGNLLEYSENRKGQEHGVCRQWYEGGQLELEYYYKNGKKHGGHRYWYPSGQIRYDEPYKDGEPHGLWRSWFENGVLSDKTHYQEGKLDGLDENWFKNGEKYYITTYVNGIRHGESIEWDKDGNKIVDGIYRGGIPYQGTFQVRVETPKGSKRTIKEFRDGVDKSSENITMDKKGVSVKARFIDKVMGKPPERSHYYDITIETMNQDVWLLLKKYQLSDSYEPYTRDIGSRMAKIDYFNVSSEVGTTPADADMFYISVSVIFPNSELSEDLLLIPVPRNKKLVLKNYALHGAEDVDALKMIICSDVLLNGKTRALKAIDSSLSLKSFPQEIKNIGETLDELMTDTLESSKNYNGAKVTSLKFENAEILSITPSKKNNPNPK